MNNTSTLIDIYIAPKKLEAQIKIMQTMALLNDEPEITEVLDMLKYLYTTAETKQIKVKEYEFSRRREAFEAQKQDLELTKYRAQSDHTHNLWGNSTTTISTSSTTKPMKASQLTDLFKSPF